MEDPEIEFRHALIHQLLGGADVVAFKVGADPGASPLPQKMRGQPGATADLEAEAARCRRQPFHEGADGLFLFKGTPIEL